MKKSKKIGTILRGVLAGCLAALAAGVPRAAEHIEMHFDRIGIADGLSQSMVMAIEQDAEGFMWFGTENGLDRFDGFNFQNYRRDWDDPGSLQSEFVRDLGRVDVDLVELVFDTPHIVYADGLELASAAALTTG